MLLCHKPTKPNRINPATIPLKKICVASYLCWKGVVKSIHYDLLMLIPVFHICLFIISSRLYSIIRSMRVRNSRSFSMSNFWYLLGKPLVHSFNLTIFLQYKYLETLFFFMILFFVSFLFLFFLSIYSFYNTRLMFFTEIQVAANQVNSLGLLIILVGLSRAVV